MALSGTRLKNEIIAALFPGFDDLPTDVKAKIGDAWQIICDSIVNEIKNHAEVNASLDDKTVTGSANTTTGAFMGAQVQNDDVSGSIS